MVRFTHSANGLFQPTPLTNSPYIAGLTAVFVLKSVLAPREPTAAS